MLNHVSGVRLTYKRISSILCALAALLILPGTFTTSLAQETAKSGAVATSQGFIDPAGPVAAAQLSHFGTISLIMAALVVIPIFIAIPLILIRYRRGARGAYKPDWEFNWGGRAVHLGLARRNHYPAGHRLMERHPQIRPLCAVR